MKKIIKENIKKKNMNGKSNNNGYLSASISVNTSDINMISDY